MLSTWGLVASRVERIHNDVRLPRRSDCSTCGQRLAQPSSPSLVTLPSLSPKWQQACSGRPVVLVLAATAPSVDEESPEVWEELKGNATDVISTASRLFQQVGAANQHLATVSVRAQLAASMAAEAEGRAAQLAGEAGAALDQAEALVSELQGNSVRLTAYDLHHLAAARLTAWSAASKPTEFQVVSEVQYSTKDSPQALMVVHLARADVAGQAYVVASIAYAAPPDEKVGEPLVLHWGCVPQPGRPWEAPPPGWHTLPPVSFPAGKAWETPFALYVPRLPGDRTCKGCGEAVLLQVPAEAVLQKGGLAFVLKRPGPQPRWLLSGSGGDFFISFLAAMPPPVVEPPSPSFADVITEGTDATPKQAPEGRQTNASATEQATVPEAAPPPAEAVTPAVQQAAGPAGAEAVHVGGTKESSSKSETVSWRDASEVLEWVERAPASRPVGEDGLSPQDRMLAVLDTLDLLNSQGLNFEKEGRAEALERLAQHLKAADQLLVACQESQASAVAARSISDAISKEAEQAKAEAERLRWEAETALGTARRAATRLRGQEVEVPVGALHQVARERLQRWLGWVASRDTQLSAEKEGEQPQEEPKTVAATFHISGVEGSVAAHAGLCREGGRWFVAVAVAAGEAFPSSLLSGAVLHWAVARREGAKWAPPPSGWVSDPPDTVQVGGAWRTPMERVSPPGYENRDDLSVYACLVQIPLEGNIRDGGLTFVLQTAADAWLKCSAHGDFFFSLRELGQTAAKKDGVEAEGEGQLLDEVAAMSPADVAKLVTITRRSWSPEELLQRQGGLGTSPWDAVPPQDLVRDLVRQEPAAERSLMHRFNIAQGMLETAILQGTGEAGLHVVTVWLRYSATRQLTWNRNYNVKPREVSAAQERLTARLAQLYSERPEARDLLRLALTCVGRGGEGDMGQRIRDEILVLQSRNQAKGGMMEEWHQKLHNNTSPDDVVICEALLAYIDSGLDLAAYWSHLKANNITRERLEGYDRPIRSEPKFSKEQAKQLREDLFDYLQTLKYVHSGADLEAAIGLVLGYRQKSVKSKVMAGEPIPGVVTVGLAHLLKAALAVQRLQGEKEGLDVELVEKGGQVLLEARRALLPYIREGNVACSGRLRDVLYLDLALESAFRGLLETAMGTLRAAARSPDALLSLCRIVSLALENACISLGSNLELVLSLKDMQAALGTGGREGRLRASAACERGRRGLSAICGSYERALQPTAEALAAGLGIPQPVADTFAEEVIRSSAAAVLSQLLSILEPALRTVCGLGSWQVISPVAREVEGRVTLVPNLEQARVSGYQVPTVLIVPCIKGNDDIPLNVVAVLTSDTPDVLSHAAVRARNGGVLLASCFQAVRLAALSRLEGSFVKLSHSQDGGEVSWARGSSATASSRTEAYVLPSSIKIRPATWQGQYALTPPGFSMDCVGQKSLTCAKLRDVLPAWLTVPPSVVIPFGSFEAILEHDLNAGVMAELARLVGIADPDPRDTEGLARIRATVMGLHPPPELLSQLREAFLSQGIAWPEGLQWEASWHSIKTVFASKWNDVAVSSLGRAGLSHQALQMAVLCQPTLPAHYAFVAHTVHPTSGRKDQIYVELVRGLGEALVGNHPGAPLRFTAIKPWLPKGTPSEAPACENLPEGTLEVVGWPSKPQALVGPLEGGPATPALIFRSDSNAEDLQGYAGAGLFDSVHSVAPVAEPVDYTTDRLFTDGAFRQTVMGRTAIAASLVEHAFGAAQDIEGIVTAEGDVGIVQTRPQV